jgi:hypothetical protein
MAEALFALNRNEQRIAPCALPGGSHSCVRDRHVSVRVFARCNARRRLFACEEREGVSGYSRRTLTVSYRTLTVLSGYPLGTLTVLSGYP